MNQAQQAQFVEVREVISRLEKQLPFMYGEMMLTGISLTQNCRYVEFVFDTGQVSCVPVHIFLQISGCKNI